MSSQTKPKGPGRGARFVSLWLVWLMLAAFSLPVYADSGSAASDTSGDGSAPASGTSDVSGDASGEAGSDAGADPEPAPVRASLYAPETEPLAEAACVMNVETGLAVYEKNADTPLVAASLVKMMTCILTMEFLEKFEWDPATALVSSAGKTWIYDALYGKNASTADIRKGETLSVEELLYAALLPSANEAALLLADLVATGNMTNFLYQMNMKAKALGCTGTVFTDPNGLSEGNLTTARDMTLIAREFMEWPLLVEIAGTSQYEMAQHELHAAAYNIFTTNRLLVSSSPYYKAYSDVAAALQAGKTGSLGEWQNFVSQASKDGQTYIVAVLHSPNAADTIGAEMDPAQYRPALVESAELYRWAFKSLTVTGAIDTTQPVKELRVRYSTETDTVLLLPSDDIRAVLEVDGDPTQLRKSYDLPEALDAPVAAGVVVGSVTLSVGDRVIGTSRLITASAVERNGTLYMLNRLGDFFTGTFFRVLLVEVVVAGLIYAGLVALAANSRQRRKAGPDPARGGAQPPGAARGAQPQKGKPAARPKAPQQGQPRRPAESKPPGKNAPRDSQNKPRKNIK